MRNIALIGFMGSGKSSVGKALSKKMRKGFIDTDMEIEKMEKRKIRQIFETNGESYFRKLETRAIMKVCKLKDYVIATGGGAVLSNGNVRALRKSSKIIWLKVTAKRAFARAKGRPLLKDLRTTKKMMKEREVHYYKASDIAITVKGTPVQVAEKIARLIK